MWALCSALKRARRPKLSQETGVGDVFEVDGLVAGGADVNPAERGSLETF